VKVKLLVGGLLASAVAMLMFVGSLAALSTNVNVLDLALTNPQNASGPTLGGLGVVSSVTDTVTDTLGVTGTNKIAEAIVNYFSGTLTFTSTVMTETVTTTVGISDVLALRDEGWGFGEIFKLYLLAAESGMTPDQIKAMRDSGMGWGQIAMDLSLSPGNKGKNLGAAVSGRGTFSDTQTVTQTQNMNSPTNGNSHGNPHGGPPGKSGDNGPSGNSGGGGPPSGKGKGK